MLKKKLVLVTIVVLMALPILTVAVVPTSSGAAAPVEGVAVADLGTVGDPGVIVNSAPCPPPGSPGHTDG
jgi:hypothetical protein